MAAITQVQLPDGNAYEITDKYALQLKNGAAEYRTSSLKSNDNLNNYTTPGTYICTEGAIATTLSNCPITLGFKLIVMQVRSVGTYCQIIIPYYLSGDASYIQYRTYNGSSWGSWHKLATTNIIEDNYVAKAGDTMTGNLGISTASPFITLKNPNIDYTTAPTSTAYQYFRFWDQNNKYTGYLCNTIYTSGRITIGIAARTGSTSTTTSYTNYLNLNVEKDGTQSVQVSTAAAWRDAIGAVNIAGDTMTGSLRNETAGSINNYITNTTSTASVGLYIGNTNGSAWFGVDRTSAGVWANSSYAFKTASGTSIPYMIQTTNTSGYGYLFGRRVSSGNTGLIRGIVVGTAAATTSNCRVDDIYLRYS